MELSKELARKVLAILYEEVVPAQGCTEPIAIAYAGAKTKEILGMIPERVVIHVSGNMIKNVKSVIVPGSGGMVGIEVAAAMGIVAGDASKDLMVIANITADVMEEVKAFLKATTIEVIHEETDTKLYVRMELYAKGESASVEIKHVHTNITQIRKNGELLLAQPCHDMDFNSSLEDRSILSIERIYEIVNHIDLNLIEPLLLKVVDLNSKIAQEGLAGTYGVNIGKIIQSNIDSGMYGDDVRNRAASFASAGSDARMSGCALPVMTTSGSGNQGMAASLALVSYAKTMNIGHEKLMRALCFSHLATVHIKGKVGRLSAYCGVICALAAVSGALAYINDEPYLVIANSIGNTLGDISGIICDGAKSSCAMKIATSTYAAFDAYLLAKEGRFLKGGEGIVGCDIETTLQNIGELSHEGMCITDKVILGIMNKK